nr:hypothetical protein [Tanacetum cinerariifolium]
MDCNELMRCPDGKCGAQSFNCDVLRKSMHYFDQAFNSLPLMRSATHKGDMVLTVKRNRREHLICGFSRRGNESDPLEEKSCLVYDTDNEKEKSMPVYDTDIEDVIEEEEGFVGKGGFGGEEDNIEDVVVVANDLCSSMVQNILSVDFEEDINTNSNELMSFGKCIIIKVSQSLFKFLFCKKYQEWYLKAPPMVDKLGFKTIKV